MQDTLPADPVATLHDAAPARRWWPRWLWLGGVAAAGWLLWEILYIAVGGNIHAVLPGKLYRGAQPSPASLEALVQRYGIRTIINVRGCCFPEDWFVGEATTCQKLGVNLEDITFSAVHLPSRDELRELVAVLDRTEYPAFIHCRQGADRTGLASMIAMLLRDEYSYAQARRELGLRFGHVWFGRTANLDTLCTLYEGWLQQRNQEHSPTIFRHWLAHEYRGGPCNAQFEKVERLFDTPRLGKSLPYRVTVRNTSSEPWRLHPLKTAGVHVTFKLINEAGEIVREERAGMIDRVVSVGETVQVTLVLPPIWIKGRYRLGVDMIEEGHCWFHQTGSEPWEEELTLRE